MYVFLLFLFNQIEGLNQYYPITSSVDTDSYTTEIIENSALGECTCDVTLNACDVYCCCDMECDYSLISYWNENYEDFCMENYIGEANKAFSQCIDLSNIFIYNQRMGMIITEVNGQLCVELDTGSIFQDYINFIDTINPDLNITNIAYNLSQFINNDQSISDTQGLYNYYFKGDQILAQYGSLIRNFPLPQLDNYGYCNNNKGPSFLYPEGRQSCYQQIKQAEEQCSFVLNPSYYTSDFNYMRGSSKNSSTSSVNVDSIYYYYQTNDTIQAQTTTSVPQSTFDSSSCTCYNALNSAFYNVYYTPEANKNYTINEIAVQLIIQDSVQFPQELCNNQQIQVVTYKQTFDLQYQIYTSGSDYFYKSGNPGYQFGLFVLVAEGTSSSGQYYISQNGYQIYSKNEQGQCFIMPDQHSLASLYASSLLFGENQILSCIVNLDYDSLRQYCRNNETYFGYKKVDLEIFNQINSYFQYLGIYGNSNNSYSEDWVSVLFQDIEGLTGENTDFEWKEDQKQCYHVIGIQVNILYSYIGYVDQPQKYIVSAKAQGIYGNWSYTQINDTVQQEYTHYLTFNFIEIPPDVSDSDIEIGLFPKLPKDLFYPFKISSYANCLSIVSMILFSIINI